jgi:hypothetical protein
MKKNSVTDFWGKSKQQLTFLKAFSPSTFIANRVELTHLSAPHCVQFANAIDVSEGLICPTKALRCTEICILFLGLPKTTSLTQFCLLYSRHSMWNEISFLFGYFRMKRERKQSVNIKSGKYGVK